MKLRYFIAGIVFAAGLLWIWRTPVEHWSACVVKPQRLRSQPNGTAKVSDLDLDWNNRLLPAELLELIPRQEAIELALKNSGEQGAWQDWKDRIRVRFLPASTLLEVSVSARSVDSASRFLEELINAQRELERRMREVRVDSILAVLKSQEPEITENLRTLESAHLLDPAAARNNVIWQLVETHIRKRELLTYRNVVENPVEMVTRPHAREGLSEAVRIKSVVCFMIGSILVAGTAAWRDRPRGGRLQNAGDSD
jgi:hypothetical protein